MRMSNESTGSNPYESPQTSPNIEQLADYKPVIFSTKGRIGRLRYLAYSMIYNFLIMFLVGILSAILIPMIAGNGEESGVMMVMVMGLIYLPVFAIFFIVARRRLHDLDRTGWLTLLMFVPLINIIFGLYLLFGPGSPGANKYGPAPQANTALEIIIGLIAPIVIIGILAAIAIPSYQEYVDRAQVIEQQAQEAQQRALDAQRQ
ncbi:MAG: DUF805 domain-containing protein [endosymbiont of Galathealinum brachiosum]|uniref:DUF805 domain-containing protein n=1 Tax=endosymbiont of Galathealinum brachiosum TaxID=2200906 RepID=A0A370DDB3_9GAMM|nr:MAG: DUF805 domain-containing protein [endosymbiont of Galathealinum brachiosum]